MIDALRDVGVTFEDDKDEELSQKALVDILFREGCVSKEQKFKQLRNMSSSKGWKARCTQVEKECIISSIRVSELIEDFLMFEIRQNDGYEGFYVAAQHGFTKSPEGMYENQTEMDDLVREFTPKRWSLQSVMKNLQLNIPKETVEMIAKAIEFGAYHMILPDDIDHLLKTLDGKKGKFVLKLKDLLTKLKKDTSKFAMVQEYPTNGSHGKFHYYECRTTVDNSLIEDEVEEIGVVQPIGNKAGEHHPSTLRQTESLSMKRYHQLVTPEVEHRKRDIESGVHTSFQSPSKKGTSCTNCCFNYAQESTCRLLGFPCQCFFGLLASFLTSFFLFGV